MLKRRSVAELKAGHVGRDRGRVVVAMRHYPRYVRKELVDEYRPELAPSAELFGDYRAALAALEVHNAAFYRVDYEARFELGAEGLAALEQLAAAARERDVVLVCQCHANERCHTDLLLLLAERRFGAPIERPIFDYPVFAARLAAP